MVTGLVLERRVCAACDCVLSQYNPTLHCGPCRVRLRDELLAIREQRELRWTKSRPCCARCGRSDRRHEAKGLCHACYQATTAELARSTRSGRKRAVDAS